MTCWRVPMNWRDWWERVGGARDLSRGDWGERQAERFLRSRCFVVLARNWRSPQDRRDELDLVCRDGDVLVFVEVKTRPAHAMVPGYFAVDRRKKRVLHRTIDAYLRALPRSTRPLAFRFDIVEVVTGLGPGAPEFRHHRNVPLFSKDYWR